MFYNDEATDAASDATQAPVEETPATEETPAEGAETPATPDAV